MGKVSIILVVGTAIIIGIFSRAMVGRSRDATGSTFRYYDKMAATNIAKSAADIYLNKLRNNPSLANGTFSESILGGSATVTLAAGTPSSSRVITSIGSYLATVDTIIAYCDSASAGSLTVNAPIMLSKGATGQSWMFNNSTIDGRNYNYNTGALDGSSPSVRGLTKQNNSVSLTFNNGGVTGSGGGPMPRDTVSLGSSQIDFSTLAQQLYPKAGQVISTSQTYATATWGTHASPQITFLTNTVIVNGSCTGEGVLVVAGSFTINGPFSWKGIIIICPKDASWPGSGGGTSFIANGANPVYGAIIGVGANVSFTVNSSGNNFLYSKGIIDYVCNSLGIGGSSGGRTKYSVNRMYH